MFCMSKTILGQGKIRTTNTLFHEMSFEPVITWDAH